MNIYHIRKKERERSMGRRRRNLGNGVCDTCGNPFVRGANHHGGLLCFALWCWQTRERAGGGEGRGGEPRARVSRLENRGRGGKPRTCSRGDPLREQYHTRPSPGSVRLSPPQNPPNKKLPTELFQGRKSGSRRDPSSLDEVKEVRLGKAWFPATYS